MVSTKTHVVDAETLTSHLKVILMKDRIKKALFNEDFAVVVSDNDTEVAISGKSSIKFPEQFAVGDLKEFTKVMGHYKGEVKVKIDKGRFVITQGKSNFRYQLADADTLDPPPPFEDHEKQLLGENPLTVAVGADAANELDGFRKLIDAHIVKFSLKDKTIRALSISATTMHEADVELGDVENSRVLKTHQKTMDNFKVSGVALRDVLDGVELGAEDTISFDFGEVLRVRYSDGNYKFLISPQVPTEESGEPDTEESGEPDTEE